MIFKIAPLTQVVKTKRTKVNLMLETIEKELSKNTMEYSSLADYLYTRFRMRVLYLYLGLLQDRIIDVHVLLTVQRKRGSRLEERYEDKMAKMLHNINKRYDKLIKEYAEIFF